MRKEREAEEDGEKDSFHSASVYSDDGKYTAAEMKAKREAKIEIDVLRRMNAAFDSDEQKSDHSLQNKRRRLTKHDLSSPEFRAKRFEEMLGRNKSDEILLEPIMDD